MENESQSNQEENKGDLVDSAQELFMLAKKQKSLEEELSKVR